MRIVDVRERSVPISRYNDPSLPSGALTTSIVALTTDVVRAGKPVVGYGFSSVGRYAQGGLIRERFAPRLLAAAGTDLANDAGTNLDPFRAWSVMLKGEKPGGHGERCVAVGTLDMAIWDAAAKIAGVPLYRFIADVAGGGRTPDATIAAYAGGGYPYPSDDLARLCDEVRAMLAQGFTHVKIKIGAGPLERDVERIEAVQALLAAPNHLAADAMNAYDAERCLAAAKALRNHHLWWFEDICDPLDFETQAAAVDVYHGAIAAGEALFSAAEAKLLDRYGGLRPAKDILLFDPVHTYGLPGYLRIIQTMEDGGWPRSAFWPHGGHLFCVHVVSALGLGGCEVNPFSFAPFGGLADGMMPQDGRIAPPQAPGIGFETKTDLHALFALLAREEVVR
ncbi:mandelate racemase [bacterium]|nr:MAG: mandelate racemase [bacterium]